jgi:hypothetical protein
MRGPLLQPCLRFTAPRARGADYPRSRQPPSATIAWAPSASLPVHSSSITCWVRGPTCHPFVLPVNGRREIRGELFPFFRCCWCDSDSVGRDVKCSCSPTSTPPERRKKLAVCPSRHWNICAAAGLEWEPVGKPRASRCHCLNVVSGSFRGPQGRCQWPRCARLVNGDPGISHHRVPSPPRRGQERSPFDCRYETSSKARYRPYYV